MASFNSCGVNTLISSYQCDVTEGRVGETCTQLTLGSQNWITQHTWVLCGIWPQ